MTKELTKQDTRDYHQLKQTIKVNAEAVVMWVNAVMEIRDRGLWAVEYPSWQEFLSLGLGMSKSRLHQLSGHIRLLSALKTTKGGEPVDENGEPVYPETEKQTRELNRIKDPRLRMKAWKAAWDGAGEKQPAAKMVGEVVDEFLSPDNRPVDAKRAPVDREALWPVFEARKALMDAQRLLTTFRKEVEAHVGGPGADYLPTTKLESLLNGLKAEMKGALPYVVCPSCRGVGCGDCQNLGWLTASQLAKWKRENEPKETSDG